MDLRSLFQSATEHPQPQNIPTQGSLPGWFHGTYYSIGNGLFDLPSGFTVNHAYDGFAILYSIRVIDKAQVSVKSKFLDSDAYKRAVATGKPVFNEFGTKAFPDPDKGLFSRMMSQLVPIAFTDNDSMNLAMIRGGLFALTETCFIHQLNPETLSSIQKVDLLRTFGYGYMSAHPLDGDDGSVYCCTYSFSTGLKYNIVQFLPPAPDERNLKLSETRKLSPDSIQLRATVSSSWKTCFGYMHSFAMTPSFFIIYEQPFLLNNLKLLTSQLQGRAPKESFEWHPEEKTNFILVDRLTGETMETKYLGPSMFIIHVVNAYEEDGHVVLDMIGRTTPSVVDNLYMKTLRENSFAPNDPPTLYRFVLPLIRNNNITTEGNLVKLKDTKATAIQTKEGILCTPATIGEPGFDYPTINANFTGKKYRYMYGTGYFEEGFYCRAICKLDLFTERIQLMKFEDTQCSGEPRFVPRPYASAEDDGLIIASVADTRTDHPSVIVFVDATTFREVARVNIPYKVAHIQHGIFLPTTDDDTHERVK